MALTLQFAADLRRLADRPLDDVSLAAARSLFLDGIAVATLGAREPGPRILGDVAIAAGARGTATLIGRGERTSSAEAATSNGAAMHVLDFEPMWNPANHALSTTLPALLALAEMDEATEGEPAGLRLLKAMAVGIEAQARLRVASGQFEPAHLSFHPPGTVGPIGSAVACGIFRQLDTDRMRHAIGIAASCAGTILANVGSMTKGLHCGGAASAGLQATELSARGFTADADALAGARGFGKAFFGREFAEGDLDFTSERPLHIVDPGPAFKLYPSQYGTHFVITAALEARRLLPAGSRIEAIRIRCPIMPYVDRPKPASGLAGKFSFQYVAAVALLDGRVTVESFKDERRFAPDLEGLLEKISLDPNPGREGRFDRMTLDVEVETDRGAVAGHCDGPPGIWGRPAPAERLREKARSCLSAVLPADRATELMDMAERIETLDGAAIRRLLSLTAADAVA